MNVIGSLLPRSTIKCVNLNKRIHVCAKHLSKAKKKVKEDQLPSKLALKHFDDFYKSIFGDRWHSIRLGLLCPHKYVALVNPYATQTDQLSQLGAINLKRFLKRDNLFSPDESFSNTAENQMPITSGSDVIEEENLNSEVDNSRYSIDSFMPISEIRYQEEILTESGFNLINQKLNAEKVLEEPIQFPRHWKIFTFPKSDLSNFCYPKRDHSGILNFYLMDGASIFPVWALDIRLGEDVADLCAAPGGKSLAMAFTNFPQTLFLADNSLSRMKRLKNVLEGYIPSESSLSNMIEMKHFDSRNVAPDSFHKILVDAPCTNDRVSVTIDDNNFYHAKRFRERVQLPDTQNELLFSGLKALKKGGSLVYSTCSLSPAQNDGVIHMALSKALEETNMTFVVKDLRRTFDVISDLVSIDYSFSYGALILPYLPCNFGPMYVAKITRTS